MLLSVSLCVVLNIFCIRRVIGKRVILRAGMCAELFKRSIEDPNNRTTSWSLTIGRRDCSICNSQDTTPSWLVTKPIPAADSKRIHVSVTMYRSECASCKNQDITVYILHKALTTDESEAARILKRLRMVVKLSNKKDHTITTHDFSFESKASTFSIVFLSAGSCTLIRNITVSYFICEKNTSSLTNLPRTVAPANGLQRVNFSCPEKSDGGTYGLCSSEGIWKIPSPCTCQEGYSLNREGKCIECQGIWYKDIAENGRCIPCPKNSGFSGEKSMCMCKTGFYRFQEENHTQPCHGTTNPPGKTNPSKRNTGNNVGLVIGISVAVNVVVLAIVSLLVYCFWTRKQNNADYAEPIIELRDIPNPGNVYEEPEKTPQLGRNPQQNRELPPAPDEEGIYEEPAQYAQLANSKREPIDDNYQGLLAHRTKNEYVEENYAPPKLEYVTVK